MNEKATKFWALYFHLRGVASRISDLEARKSYSGEELEAILYFQAV